MMRPTEAICRRALNGWVVEFTEPNRKLTVLLTDDEAGYDAPTALIFARAEVKVAEYDAETKRMMEAGKGVRP